MDALVKRLVRQTAQQWRVKQFNPSKEFDLERSTWQQAMLVVGKYSRR
jgi:phage repressor protein C with HTH and peptisase S24 domain